MSFPSDPPAEWFVVDLLRHADQAGTDRADLARNLATQIDTGRFDAGRLFEMAARFAGRRELDLVRQAVTGALSK